MLTRRSFLNRTVVAAGMAALPRFALAERQLGTGTLTTVSDGTLSLPRGFITAPMPTEPANAILNEYGITGDQLEPECNLALYRDGTNTVLFDVGSGPDFMPNAGTVLDSLDAAGISTDDVTHVVFTHAHPDHIWGLIDDFDELVFPDATYLMGRAEWDYWWNPETVNTIGDARAAFAVGAKRRMEFIEDSVEFFDAGDEILPGISAVATHGHTPGHMGFELAGGAMVVGDSIGNHHVAFHHPEWESGSDQDAVTAAATRKMLLDRLSHEQTTLVGFHLPGGGIGRVEAKDGAYRFVPEA